MTQSRTVSPFQTVLPAPVQPDGGPVRRWCRRCGHELTDAESRLNGYGPRCDPNRHPGTHRTQHIEQDPIPGT
ncbi:DUF6011 domain-containing protein [Streptomyces olivoreticuli]